MKAASSGRSFPCLYVTSFISMGRFVPVDHLHLSLLEERETDVRRGAAEHIREDHRALARFHVFQGVCKLFLYLIDILVGEDIHVLELLLLSHYQLGCGNHFPGEVEMSHHDDPYHRSSLSMSLCSTATL